MLSRPGPLPSGTGWSFEVKWDGFRAVISTERGLRIRSRRGSLQRTGSPELSRPGITNLRLAPKEGVVIEKPRITSGGRRKA